MSGVDIYTKLREKWEEKINGLRITLQEKKRQKADDSGKTKGRSRKITSMTF